MNGKNVVLNFEQRYALANFVQQHYVQSRLNDPEFAEKASGALGFNVTQFNIRGLRQQFHIQSSLDRIAEERKQEAARKQEMKEKLKAMGVKTRTPVPDDVQRESLRDLIERLIILVEKLPQAVVQEFNK